MLITKIKSEDHITFADLAGPINVHSQGEMHASIVDNPDTPGDNVVLNFEQVTNISSSGIGILVTACMEIQKQGRIVKIAKVPTQILERLDVQKVLPLFNVFLDVESAARQIKIDVEQKGKFLERLFERINIDLDANFRVHKKGKLAHSRGYHDAIASNLTKRDMFIKTEVDLDPEVLVDVKLSFGDGIFKKESVGFLGKVINRIQPTEDVDAGISLVILQMESRDVECLEMFLEKCES